MGLKQRLTSNMTARFMLASLFLAVLYVGAWQLGRRAPVMAVTPATLPPLPDQLGPWSRRALPLNPKELPPPPMDVLLDQVQLYTDAKGDNVIANVSLFGDSDVGVPHPPEQCYSLSGGLIHGHRDMALAIPGRDGVSARLLMVEKDGQRACVLYWYQLGEYVVTSRFELATAKWSLRGDTRSLPIVKVMLHTSANQFDEAEGRLRSIAEPLLAWTRALAF